MVIVAVNRCATLTWLRAQIRLSPLSLAQDLIGLISCLFYWNDFRLGCSQLKTKSVSCGKIVVSSPKSGAMPKVTIFSQKSMPSSPGRVRVGYVAEGGDRYMHLLVDVDDDCAEHGKQGEHGYSQNLTRVEGDRCRWRAWRQNARKSMLMSIERMRPRRFLHETEIGEADEFFGVADVGF